MTEQILLAEFLCGAPIPDELEVADFTDWRHQIVFAAIRNVGCDLLTVEARIVADGYDGFVGGYNAHAGVFAFLGALMLAPKGDVAECTRDLQRETQRRLRQEHFG